MKHLVERMISAVLAAALVFCTAMPVWAEDYAEGIFEGVKLIASLDKSTITESNENQTVVLTIKTSKPVTLTSFNMSAVEDEGIKVESVSGASEKIYLQSDNYNRGEIEWNISNGAVEDITNLIEITYNVPANTEAGAYKLGVSYISLSNNDEKESCLLNEQGVYATLTITKAIEASGYTASITAGTEDITVDGAAEVFVSVKHTNNENFAAGEMVLTYDNERLTFNKNASIIGNAVVKNESGVLTIEDYGEEKTFGNSVYKLAFTPKKDGTATVMLTSAAFVNKTDAAKRDLIPATISPATANFTVAKRRYTVTLPEGFTGATEAVDGEKYTFRASDYEHYDYTNVTATVGGNKVTVTDDGKGNYTIEAVNGIVEISGTRTPKKYNVTFEGNGADDIKNKQTTAIYDTDYTFIMPTAEDYAYKVEEITIDGKTYKDYTIKDLVSYTIPGKAITGNICISVSKTRTAVQVKVNGDGASAAGDYSVKAEPGKGYTLTIEPEAGYTYTVTAMMSGQKVDLTDARDNTYTIQNVTGDIVFTVTRMVITDKVTVADYLGVNGNKMWLVLQGTQPAEGKVPTYDNTPMFWSNKYEAYCYLVMTQTLAEDAAQKKIDIIDGTATSVNYDMDVNMTKKVDASDAQLVYNMYNADYSAFTEEMTMEKFLRADVNGDKKVNVTDAAAIISHLLKLETESQ
ncbi:dockerin type I repeat-containing protein [Gemmiger sp.]